MKLRERLAVYINRASIQLQLIAWLAGLSIHNRLRNECCPDFSCCCKPCRTPFKQRMRFGALRLARVLGLQRFLPKNSRAGGLIKNTPLNRERDSSPPPPSRKIISRKPLLTVTSAKGSFDLVQQRLHLIKALSNGCI